MDFKEIPTFDENKCSCFACLNESVFLVDVLNVRQLTNIKLALVSMETKRNYFEPQKYIKWRLSKKKPKNEKTCEKKKTLTNKLILKARSRDQKKKRKL